MSARLGTAAFLAAVVGLSVGASRSGGALSGPVGVTISPAYQQISILPGEDAQPVSFKITNNEPKTQSFSLSVNDFNTLDESGGLFFAGTNPSQLQQKYGLAKWMSLPFSSLTLAPGQSQVVQAKILNPPDLSPGGHYGALLLAVNGGSGVGANVSLHPIASSLMFVTKVGGDIHSLELASVSAEHDLFSLPKSVNLRFHDSGNSHVVPRGIVTITDNQGKVFEKGIINTDSNIILPQTYRQLYVPLETITAAKTAGHYQLRVDFRFDGFDQYREYRSSFTYVPTYWLGLILLIILAARLLLWSKKGDKLRFLVHFGRRRP